MGSIPSLGNWNTSNPVKMYFKDSKHWIVSLPIPLDEKIEYNYFIVPSVQSKDQNKVKWLS